MISLPKNIDFSKITVSKLQSKDSSLSKSVYLNLGGNPIVIQIPQMYAPFGMSKYNATEVVNPDVVEKYTINMSLKETNKSVKNFIEFLRTLDEFVLDQSVKNSANWFKKEKKREVLEDLYTPLVINSNDPSKYAPTFKINVPVQNGTIKCECFNQDKEPVVLSTIEKGSQVSAIIQLQGIWFVGNKFGCSWKPLQIRVQQPNKISGYSFNDDDDEDNNEVFVPSDNDEEEETVVPAPEEVVEEEIEFKPVVDEDEDQPAETGEVATKKRGSKKKSNP